MLQFESVIFIACFEMFIISMNNLKLIIVFYGNEVILVQLKLNFIAFKVPVSI